jgi:hypothetical protein
MVVWILFFLGFKCNLLVSSSLWVSPLLSLCNFYSLNEKRALHVLKKKASRASTQASTTKRVLDFSIHGLCCTEILSNVNGEKLSTTNRWTYLSALTTCNTGKQQYTRARSKQPKVQKAPSFSLSFPLDTHHIMTRNFPTGRQPYSSPHSSCASPPHRSRASPLTSLL